jgi:hypothetical protein
MYMMNSAKNIPAQNHLIRAKILLLRVGFVEVIFLLLSKSPIFLRFIKN